MVTGGGEDICIGAIFAKTFALLFLNDTSNYFLPTICKYASDSGFKTTILDGTELMKLIYNTMKGSILKILLDVRNLFRAQANGVRSHRGQNKRRSVSIFFFLNSQV